MPDNDPSAPLRPFGGRSLGAGNPFKKCSSSASVPLSLVVDSRCCSDTGAWLSRSSSALLPALEKDLFEGLADLTRSEA